MMKLDAILLVIPYLVLAIGVAVGVSHRRRQSEARCSLCGALCSPLAGGICSRCQDEHSW